MNGTPVLRAKQIGHRLLDPKSDEVTTLQDTVVFCSGLVAVVKSNFE